MSFFNYPDHVLPTRNEVLVDFSEQINAAKLSSKAINNLPDSDFAYISPGGTKDSEGKTIPRSLRHLPIPDAAHVRNALARLNQTKIPAAAKKAALAKIKRKAEDLGVHVSESDGASEKQKAAKEKFLEMINKKKGGDKKDADKKDADKKDADKKDSDKKSDDKKSDDKKSSKKDESKGEIKQGQSDYPNLDKPTSAKTKKQWDKTDKKELKRDTKKEKKEHEKDAVKDDESKIKKLEKGKPSEKKRAEVFYLKKDKKIDKKNASRTVSTVAAEYSTSTGPEPTGPEPTGPEPTGPEPTGPEPTGPDSTGPAVEVCHCDMIPCICHDSVATHYPTMAFKPVPFGGTLESAPYSKLLEPVDWEKLKKELSLNTLWFKKPKAPKVDYRKFLDPHFKP